MTIFTSPLPPLTRRDQSISDRVFEGLARAPEALALVDGVSGVGLTAGAFMERVRRLAGGLQAQGVGPGVVVAIFAPNMPEFAVVFHAVALAGAAITTVNPTYTAHELTHQLTDSGASWLFTLQALRPVADVAAGEAGVKRLVDLDGGIEPLLGAALAAQVPVDLDRHVVVLPYSSGTTGLPKGVRLSHRNMVANVDQVLAGLDVRAGEMTVAFLPFFHIYGMNTLMNVFLAGGSGLVTMPRFDLVAFLTHIQTYGMRLVLIAPPVAVALAKHPLVDQFNITSLKQILSGAAPLSAEVAAEVSRRLGCTLLQGYGMTELSPVSHLAPVGDRRPGSVGVPLPDTMCRIVDPVSGADLGPGQEGELWVKGPQVMLGYLNAPEANARTLHDGWLSTGDLAVADAEGHFAIKDRLKELIKVSGFQVPPAEVEAELLTHPDVADAAVIGLPDDVAGERPVAFVVPQGGHPLDVAAVTAYLAGRLASYKVPREVHVVAAIPKSASGKILRRVLKAQLLAG